MVKQGTKHNLTENNYTSSYVLTTRREVSLMGVRMGQLWSGRLWQLPNQPARRSASLTGQTHASNTPAIRRNGSRQNAQMMQERASRAEQESADM